MHIINDETNMDICIPVIDGERVSTGCVPRNYHEQPFQVRGVSFPTFTKQTILDIIRERKKRGGGGLRSIRRSFLDGKPIPSLNQGQFGYCWAHSSTHANILVRATMNLPYVPLSAFMVASIIKNGRDEGGWAALSLDYITKYGQCAQSFWPQQNASLKFNTPEARANAALHRVSESFLDLDAAVYDRKLTYDQFLTLLVCGIPVPADFYWWGHSVCGIDVEEVDGEPWPVIWNSWGDSWGELGEGILQGNRAIPNGAVAPRASVASIEAAITAILAA